MFLRDFKRVMRVIALLLSFTMAAYPFHTFGITFGSSGAEPRWEFDALVRVFSEGMSEFDDWPAEQTLYLREVGAGAGGFGVESGELLKPGGLGMLDGFSALGVSSAPPPAESDTTSSSDKFDNEFCTVQTQPDRSGNDCLRVTTTDGNNLDICPGDDVYKQLKPSPIPGISKLATTVGVHSDCGNFNKGPMDCWVDIDGVTQCPVNDGDIVDTCQELRDDPQCAFIRSECIEGAEGAQSGHCYAYEDIYDCGYGVEISDWEKSQSFACGGPVRCMGNDCFDPDDSDSAAPDFGRVAGLLDAAQSMSEDMDCVDDPTSEAGVRCSVFTGEASECKAALGGWVDCCKKPGGVSIVDYITLIVGMKKMDTAVTGMQNATGALGAIQDGYTALRQPLANGFSQITQPFSSVTSNISAAYDGAKTAVNEFASDVITKGKELAAKAFGGASQAAGTAATSAGGEAAIADATGSLTEQLLGEAGAAFLGTVMMIYTIYTVANLVVNIIWACTEDELQLGVKRELKNCSRVGTYCRKKVLGACIEKRTSFCCFNSPLSRIIQEQARPQLGMSFGSAKSPTCGGIPLDRFAQINWDRINLDEWLALLKISGNMPGQDGFDMERLTGSGSFVPGADGLNVDRKNTLDRNLERLDGVDGDNARKAAEGSVPISTGAPTP